MAAVEELDALMSCSLDDLKDCPSARILRILLMRMTRSLESMDSESKNDSDNEKQAQIENSILESIRPVMENYVYSATKLLDDLHHLQYDHGLNSKDSKFDAAYEFFKDCIPENGCNINDCLFIARHYRERGREVTALHEPTDEVLLDIMAQIHCYFVHSFDSNRLTKEERNRVEMESSYGVGLDEDDHDANGHGIDGNNDIYVINDILSTKKETMHFRRDDRRYRDTDDVRNAKDSNHLKQVNFAAMALVVGVDEALLRERLSEYSNDRDKLIADLMDAVYHHDAHLTLLWLKLTLEELEDDAKENIFRNALFRHFMCTHLNRDNFIKMSKFVIIRRKLQIDANALIDVVTTNEIDGRMFDKTDIEHFLNNGTFSKHFKGLPDCKMQHVRQLYTFLRKWIYVEEKKVVVKSEETEIKEEDPIVSTTDEMEQEDDDEAEEEFEEEDPLEVYEVGKRFYFWDPLKGHRDFVKAKHYNMKEEIFHSPLLDGLVSIRAWNKLTKDIAVIIATETALRITSNGRSFSLYGIQRFEPLDAEHLRALKLYTDFNDLCNEFCAILRWGDAVHIEEIANFTRILIETVQCYGSPMTAQQNFYRGINRSFLFKTIATRFNLPWSTTTSVKSNIF